MICKILNARNQDFSGMFWWSQNFVVPLPHQHLRRLLVDLPRMVGTRFRVLFFGFCDLTFLQKYLAMSELLLIFAPVIT